MAGECSCEPVLSPQSPGWHSHPTVHNNALLCSIYATRTLHHAREKLAIGSGHVMAVEQMKRRVSQAQARWEVRVVMGVRGGWCRSLPWARKSDCTLLSSAPLTHTLTLITWRCTHTCHLGSYNLQGKTEWQHGMLMRQVWGPQ